MPKDETAWLIEHRGTGHAPTYWAGGKEFTFDHLRAIRFARKEDAEQVMRSTEQMKYTTRDLVAADHMWCDRQRETSDV